MGKVGKMGTKSGAKPGMKAPKGGKSGMKKGGKY